MEGGRARHLKGSDVRMSLKLGIVGLHIPIFETSVVLEAAAAAGAAAAAVVVLVGALWVVDVG